MALERAREHELREKQLELGAIRFYELAHALLLNEGTEYTKTISGSYLRPVPGSGQGGPLESVQWGDDIPYLVFAAVVRDYNGNTSTVVLASIAEGRSSFKKSPGKISEDVLHESTGVGYCDFELYVANGEFGIEEVLGVKKHVLKFDVGHWEVDENCVTIYGKPLLEGSNYRQDINQETANEFLELVDLLNRLSTEKGFFTKIEPQHKNSPLDKLPA